MADQLYIPEHNEFLRYRASYSRRSTAMGSILLMRRTAK